MGESEKYNIVVIGGGAAGITVAAKVAGKAGSMAIIEPSEKHHYQPLWTLVGGGVSERGYGKERKRFYSKRRDVGERRRDGIFPDENYVMTRAGKKIGYDFLVVCPGIQLDWDKVKGLKENVGKNGVCSNYSYATVESTWQNIRSLKSGIAVFTQPTTPIKCGGAPQKIAYLAEDYFRNNGVRDAIEVKFFTGTPTIFTSPHYAPTLTKHCDEKGISRAFKHSLVEIRAESKEAIFQDLDAEKEVVQKFDMIHVTPPMSAPDFIKASPLVNEAGWVDVDKETLQHTKYPNIFALGDASNLPTSKTGAAIRKQAPVVAQNLLSAINGKSLDAKYDGYTSCPLVTGYKSLIMAEFGYDLKPQETFPIDQNKERYSMYLVKKWLLPKLYWHGMLRGRA